MTLGDSGKTPEQEEGKREVVIWGGSGKKTLGPIGTGVRPPLRSLGMSDFSGCHGVLYFVYSLTWLAPYFVRFTVWLGILSGRVLLSSGLSWSLEDLRRGC